MAATKFPNPGIAYVTTSFYKPGPTDEEAYLRWVDEHISRTITSSGVHSSFLCKNIDPRAHLPYLVIYSMDDIEFFQSEEFRRLAGHNSFLDNGKQTNAVMDVRLRMHGSVQRYDLEDTRKGNVRFLVTGGLELGDSTTEQEYQDWYNQEHFERLSKVPGYICSTRFKLSYHRTTTETRAFKGLPPRDGVVEEQEPPTWHAIHEFDEKLDMKLFMESIETEWSKKIFESSKRSDHAVYTVEKGYGEGKMVN